jgi:hypothetical protein
VVTLADLVPKSRVISYSTDAGRLSSEQVLLTNFIVIKTNERERERIVDTRFVSTGPVSPLSERQAVPFGQGEVG